MPRKSSKQKDMADEKLYEESIVQEPLISPGSVNIAISPSEDSHDIDIRPLKTPVVAKGHPALYRMHRYFARRPHNVFESIVKHYSKPGDIILDPFSGGGVTVIEGLRAGRKVIGIDVNPMAIFITQMEITQPNLNEFKKAKGIIDKQREKILDLYTTECPNCKKQAIAEWIEWSYIGKCPACHKLVRLGHAKKLVQTSGRVKFACGNKNCIASFGVEDCKRIGEEIIRIKYSCDNCQSKGEKHPDKKDISTNKNIEKLFDIEKAEGLLKYPSDELPDGNLVRENALREKGFKFFADFYTKRNLLALSRLNEAIRNLPVQMQQHMLFAFTSMLYECSCRLCHIKDGTVVKPGHDWWPPIVFASNNVWKHFETRYATVLRGLTAVQEELGDSCRLATTFNQLLQDATALLIRGSSERMPIPDSSVDAVITDPPFGSNVQYGEQTDLWAIWIKDISGISGLTDKTKEAIATRHTGFANAKSLEHYENKLYEIFKECHRVLKPHGWMVMTFHNRDLAVWMALQRAANNAGFKLPDSTDDPNRGMLYQPPIEQYTTTLRQRPAGAMLGDFILSFKRQESPANLDDIVESLSTEEEQLLKQRTEELIEFHGGADENLLYTGLLPYLQERYLLQRLRNFDLRSFFNKYFIYDKSLKKWFHSKQLDSQGKPLTIIDYIPANQLTEQLVVEYLYKFHHATLDDLLTVIYTTLVNSKRPGIETVYRTVNRLCDKTKLSASKREVYILKRDIPQHKPGAIHEMPISYQGQLFTGETAIVENLTHNQIIELLAGYFIAMGYQVHIGDTEQRKEKRLRDISIQMLSNVEFGIPLDAFSIIKEIDLLVIRDHSIFAALEVATTISTVNKAINDRFRNLFIVLPRFDIKGFVIVNSQDYQSAKTQLLSPANRKQHLEKKVTILKVSQLSKNNIEAILR